MGYCAAAFGLGWRSEVELPLFQQLPAVSGDVEVRLVEEIVARSEVARQGNAVVFADGARYRADDGTLIDIIGTDRIDLLPAAGWTGEVPVHFYGTAAAMLLALRGLIPIHGTALDVGGAAILLCGRSGAGKSTLAANLIGLGARLISDDLTALRALAGQDARLLSGRPGMRLHPGTAKWLAARSNVESIEVSHHDKLLVRPTRVPPFSEWPLKAIYLLDRQDTALPDPLRDAAFRAQIFRPKLMRKLPGHDERVASLEALARMLGLVRMLDLSGYSQNLALERAERILEYVVASAA